MHFQEPRSLESSQDGDPIIFLKLGQYYFCSTHLENNCEQAFEWIHRSADQGNSDAQFWIADLYSLGQGTQQSNTEAYHYYTKAAIQGCEKAQKRLHYLYHDEIMLQCPGVLNKEEESHIPLKNRNTPSSTKKLYEFRTKYIRPGLVKNSLIAYFCERFEWYQYSDLLNPHGDNETQTNLAYLYQHGFGVMKDTKQAIILYTKAAERGYTDAQYNLAYLCQNEMMEDESKYEEVFYWYSSAARDGHIAAQKQLSFLFQQGFKTNDHCAIDQYMQTGDKASEGFTWIPDESSSDFNTNYKSITNENLCTRLNKDISIINESVYTDEIKELIKSALSGNNDAMYQVGKNYYHKNDGFPCDQYIGCQWIKMAAVSGLDDAQLFIGKIYKEDDVFEQNYFKASIWFKRAKQKKAKFQLGLLYDMGLGVERDLEKAKILLAEAVDDDCAFELGLFYYYNGFYNEALSVFEACLKRGDIEAVYRIKNMYWNGYGVEKNEQTAFQLLEYTASRGNVKSQLALASLYTRGSFINRNLAKATEYYFMAAEAGDPFAKYQMAMKYLSGENVRQSYTKAFHLFEESAKQGCELAVRVLKILPDNNHYYIDTTNTLNMFLFVTEHGLADLEYSIGCIYEKQVYRQLDVLQGRLNVANAIHWYTISANKSNTEAQYRLGFLLEEGRAVEMDLPRASEYYRMALSSRHCEATFRLACMYIDGRGVEQDLIKAFHLFNDAVNMGHKQAKDIIELQCYIKDHKYTTYTRNINVTVQISNTNNTKMLEEVATENHAMQYKLGNLFKFREPARALFWYEKAAKGGITDAYYQLGVMYEEGREGIKQDHLKASQMYHLCIHKDHDEALYRLGQMYQYGKGVKQDYIRAYHLYEKAVELRYDVAFKVLNIAKKSDGYSRSRFYDFPNEKLNDSILMWEYVAQQGNSQAQYELGITYQSAFSDPIFPECIKWYSMATHHKNAIRKLGYLYEKGLGELVQDTRKAIKLYEEARELGDLESIYRLGLIYYDGTGVEMNAMKAILFYIEAAKEGHINSKNKLSYLYTKGDIARHCDSKLLKGCESINRQRAYNAYRDYIF